MGKVGAANFVVKTMPLQLQLVISTDLMQLILVILRDLPDFIKVYYVSNPQLYP